MQDFDPKKPAILHDRVSDRMIPWTGDDFEDFEKYAEPQGQGLVAWQDFLFDGWGNPLGG